MTDIIQQAKRLLEETTPAPWVTGGKDSSGNVYVGNPSSDGNLVATTGISDAALIAAAPELAAALAEETWEYSYQELRGDEWETAFNDVTHLEEWWPKKSDVDWIVEEALKHGYVCRLVRRRVSPIYMAELI